MSTVRHVLLALAVLQQLAKVRYEHTVKKICLTACIFNSAVQIGLERSMYIGSETDEITEEICAVLFLDFDQYVTRSIDGVINAIRNDFDITTGPLIINAAITSSVSTAPDAAIGKSFIFHLKQP